MDVLAQLIDTSPREDCLAFFADKSAKERRELAPAAMKLLKNLDADWLSQGTTHDYREREERIQVCVLATATASELIKLGWRMLPWDGFILDVVKALKPDWVDEWLESLVEQTPRAFNDVRLLYEANLCQKPTGDGYILGMIDCLPDWKQSPTALWDSGMTHADRIRSRPDIRDEDIWRLFEVEGGGDLSLATHEKYIGRKGYSWSAVMLELASDGTLDRDRLLDESLQALARDFAQFRAGWFSRFHEALEPTIEERAARSDRYLLLLGSSIPPTVSFSLKAVVALDKAGKLSAVDLLAHLPPVLQARAKGTVNTGLRLITNAVKREPDLSGQGARLAVDALIHESADVQKKALALIESLDGLRDPDTRAAMQGYAEGIAPSLRKTFEELVGVTEARAEPVSPVAAPAKASVSVIEPIATYTELNQEFLRLLEDPSDPLQVERLLDGLARLGATRPPDFEELIGPLKKRSVALIKRMPDDQFQFQLARLASRFAGNDPLEEEHKIRFPLYGMGNYSPLKENTRQTFEAVFARRGEELLSRIEAGLDLPLLSAPTDSRGFVDAGTLVARYMRYKHSGITPSPTDMVLAFLRLAPDAREEAARALDPRDEYQAAMAFALGADVPVGSIDWLWVAAAAARLPRIDHEEIARKHGHGCPDAGSGATYQLQWKGNERYSRLNIVVEPQLTGAIPETFLTSTFHATTADDKAYGSVCGLHVNMVRWSATVWPLNPQAFFSQGMEVFDHSQILTNSPYVGFIEPMLQQHIVPDNMGALLLALGIGSSDPAVKTVALDAAIAAIEQDRLAVEQLCKALGQLIPARGFIPVGRWTKSLGELSEISGKHAAFVRDTIAGALRHDPAEPPRDIGGLVELLYELTVATGEPLQDAGAIEYLQGVTAGGKLKRFAGKLLAEAEA